MLDYLRQRVIEAIRSVPAATLATYGPAGLQAGQFPCEADDLRLYMLLPATAEHLHNLETRPDVVTTPVWQMRGSAVVLDRAAYPPGLHLSQIPEAQWSRLIEFTPAQFNLRRNDGHGFSETIDIDQEEYS